MMQQRRIGRVRRMLRLEPLEDRTLLSGLVLALEDPLTGVLSITGDQANNHITISQITPGVLRVAGDITIPSPPSRPDATSVNSVTYADFTLATISAINVTMLNGTDRVTMTGFSIPGNITITAGSGVDTFSLSSIQTNAGIIRITATGSDTVTESNVVAGVSTITTGDGPATITQTNVTFGQDTIHTGNGNDNITITNSQFRPPPRLYAIGSLSITSGDGNDTINIDSINAGPSTIVAGSGNNTIKYVNSTIQMANITTGRETVGAVGSNTVTISNDTILGSALNVNVLNQSGVSGSGPNAAGGGSINTVTMNNVQFTAGGNLNLRVDDGIPYFNRNKNNELDSASAVVLTLIDTSGNVNVTLGDHFQLVQLGNSTVGLNDIDANNLTLSVGNDVDVIVVTAIVQESETITIGNVSTNPIPPLPPPSVLINGSVGDGDDADGLSITIGSNNNGNLGSGWPITVNETVQGSLMLGGGDGLALNIAQTQVSGLLSVTLGNGGPGDTESLTMTAVTAGDGALSFESKASDAPDGNANAGVTINLVNVQITDPSGGLSLSDSGAGADSLNMVNVNVAQQLSVNLSSGINIVVAQNVTCLFGMIDGGSGPSNLYVDRGGDYGYVVLDFAGRIAGPYPPRMDASGLSLSATAINQGDTVTLTGTFSQPGNWDSHTVTINWGDGTGTTQLQLAPGVFTFSARHQYLDEPAAGAASNTDTIGVTVVNSAGDTASAATTITVNDLPPVIPAGGLQLNASTINEGGSVILTGSFADPDVSNPHQVVINWGDGSTPSSFTLAAGVFAIGPMSHTYQASLPGNAPYTILVTVSDEDNASGSASTQVTVNHVPPANLSAGFASPVINEGDTATLNGSFTAPGLDTHTVVINWGDGSANTTLNLGPGIVRFKATHQYQDNLPGDAPYTVRLTVSDPDNASTSASTQVTVKNVPPAVTDLDVVAGSTTTLNGTITDPGLLDSHTVVVNWGDGSATTTLSLAAGVLNFSADHQYQATLPGNAPYTIQVTVSDKDNGSTSASTSLAVDGGIPSGSVAGSLVPSLTLSGPARVNEGSPYTLNLSSRETGTNTISSVAITWGDGTVQTVTGNPSSVTHVYSEGPNNYTILARATDQSSTFAAANTVAVQVVDAPPTLTLSGPASSNPLSPYTLTLSSSDPGTDTITGWTINWGDGTSDSVVGDPSSVTHTYALVHRRYTISAQATNGDGTFSAGNTLTVNMSFATDNENYIAQVYLDLLGRPVDLSGLQSWTDHLQAGASRDQVVLWITQSLEYRTLRVEQLYQTYLGRPADPLGLRNDVLALGAGATTDQVKADILGSEEYFSMRASGTMTGFFSALYYDVLGRSGTASEIQAWLLGEPANTSRTALASLFINSVEANQFLVQGLYQKYLHRGPDPNGLSTFVQSRENGASEESVIAALLASDEYFQRAVS